MTTLRVFIASTSLLPPPSLLVSGWFMAARQAEGGGVRKGRPVRANSTIVIITTIIIINNIILPCVRCSQAEKMKYISLGREVQSSLLQPFSSFSSLSLLFPELGEEEREREDCYKQKRRRRGESRKQEGRSGRAQLSSETTKKEKGSSNCQPFAFLSPSCFRNARHCLRKRERGGEGVDQQIRHGREERKEAGMRSTQPPG